MIAKLLFLVFVTWLPFFELRASIPLGILSTKISLPFGLSFGAFGLSWGIVLPVVLLANILIGPLVLFGLNKFVHHLLKVPIFSGVYGWSVLRTRAKVSKHVDRYGMLGMAIFIGLPLPGSGSYSGALGAHLLGMDFKKYIVANTFGVLIAGALVTLATLGILQLPKIF